MKLDLDLDQLDRDIAAIPGNDLVVSKDQLALLIAAARRPQGAAALALTIGQRRMDATIAEIGMRVSGGYPDAVRPIRA